MRLVAGFLPALALVSAFATLGPPHITVSPVTPDTRGAPAGAVLLVTGEHHNEREQLTVTARAEGLREGRSVTQRVALTSTGPGQYAVMKQWSAGTPWVLVFTAEQGDDGKHGVAEAMVKVDAAGRIVGIEHPQPQWLTGSRAPRRLTRGEIAAALATMSAH